MGIEEILKEKERETAQSYMIKVVGNSSMEEDIAHSHPVHTETNNRNVR